MKLIKENPTTYIANAHFPRNWTAFVGASGIFNMEEIWKDIEGYGGLYQVSNFGNVKSFRVNKNGKIMIPQVDAYGYMDCKINRKHNKVHRLVAKAFIPNPENKQTVNHIDGNPKNNHVSNLEWATPKEQVNHAFRIGLTKKRYGVDNKFSKKVYQYTKDGKFVAEHVSGAEVERIFGITKFHIYACCNGKRKTTGGYVWSRIKLHED